MVGFLNGVAFFVFLGTAMWGYKVGNDINTTLSVFNQPSQQFQYQAAMFVWVPGFLIGSFFLALARIIELLEKKK
ncbi:hypothetical protein [Cohnella cholangitidis]|uniref:Uncharacterized protein n=1 Tax=Cohnella cholangitidis TaxID=2598458 RepID=A0A7G5BTA0_9BACL|nr:hypothetical protein [Cohnella cholangitidis]QMV40184.1 hypothetical protein FPL14_02430 [Cohnella cholangitidis]